ncbi:hypothetical protein [Novosphingobium subterraneum]|uniref:hypothetical protein n=1 Tax=Novosphingobium subterraneum TaxID=48936 RepID=UPI0012E8074A|nr:hypothetical protein [Novosphingobium subterraneum]
MSIASILKTQVARLLVAVPALIVFGQGELKAYTPPPVPPTAEQIEAVRALIAQLAPWDADMNPEMRTAVANWLREQHSDATPNQRAAFMLKVAERYRKAMRSPDDATLQELAIPYRYIEERSVHSLMAFLDAPDGYSFRNRFEDLPIRHEGAARRVLPQLTEIFAEAVEGAARLEEVNKKKR